MDGLEGFEKKFDTEITQSFPAEASDKLSHIRRVAKLFIFEVEPEDYYDFTADREI